MLKNENSSRITWAAAFVPNDKGDAVQYVLPQGIRLASGFVPFDYEEHHRSKGRGMLCCGNCYDEGKLVEVSHRRETAKHIGGGDVKGRPGTFAAYANTTGDHTQYCNDRRANLRDEHELKQGIKFNFNMEETYSTASAPYRAHKVARNHKLETTDARLDGRQSIAINDTVTEFIRAVASRPEQQVRNAMYVVDGRVSTHREIFIDGDTWQDMTSKRRNVSQAPKIFHVTIPVSKHLRSIFNNAAEDGTEDEVKISCRQYEFKDRLGKTHVIQPSIVTNNRNVKALFEEQGDYVLVGKYTVIPFKRNDVTIHQVKISIESTNQVHELYAGKSRIKDYDAMKNLEQDFETVSVVDPKAKAAPAKKPEAPLAGYQDLFAAFTV